MPWLPVIFRQVYGVTLVAGVGVATSLSAVAICNKPRRSPTQEARVSDHLEQNSSYGKVDERPLMESKLEQDEGKVSASTIAGFAPEGVDESLRLPEGESKPDEHESKSEAIRGQIFDTASNISEKMKQLENMAHKAKPFFTGNLAILFGRKSEDRHAEYRKIHMRLLRNGLTPELFRNKLSLEYDPSVDFGEPRLAALRQRLATIDSILSGNIGEFTGDIDFKKISSSELEFFSRALYYFSQLNADEVESLKQEAEYSETKLWKDDHFVPM